MNIIIADDHTFVRSGLCDAVTRIFPDANIFEAREGGEVLNILRQEQSIDLALIDLFMPDIGGFALLRKMLSLAPEVPMMVISATTKVSHIHKVIELGASAFLHKNESEDEFDKAVKLVLSGGTYFPKTQRVAGRQERANEAESTLMLNRIENILTTRQLEIFAGIGQGKSNKQIAVELGLAENTIKVHVSTILKALNLDNRTQVGVLANKLKLA